MLLSELLDREVRDESGRCVGRVHDARVVQDGPVLGSFGAAYRVHGLIAGRWAVGSRLGYDRAGVNGPLPLRLLMSRALAHSTYVPWERIARMDDQVIVIRGSADDLGSPEILA